MRIFVMLGLFGVLALCGFTEPRAENDTVRKRDVVCAKGKSETPPMLREDLAYSMTGVDCYGDLPADGFTFDYDLPEEVEFAPPGSKEATRSPASEALVNGCPDTKHSHPKGMRWDLEYSLTGLDCQGDSPDSAF
jgi:hypothetical protein